MKVKLCRFDRIGYCRVGKDKCFFYHADETCEIYEELGFCFKLVCQERHPRPCRYFRRGRCYRENECKYLHRRTDHVENVGDPIEEHIDVDEHSDLVQDRTTPCTVQSDVELLAACAD